MLILILQASKLKTLNSLQLPGLPARPVKGTVYKANGTRARPGFAKSLATIALAVAVAAVLTRRYGNSGLNGNLDLLLSYLPGWLQAHLRI